MPIVVFVVVLLTSWFNFGGSVSAAPELCPASYTCTVDQYPDRDCIPKTTNGCVMGAGQTGNWCCNLGGQPTPAPAGSCVGNGNYCVGTSTECAPGDIPFQGGTCPASGVCCQVPGNQSPGSTPIPMSTPLPPQIPQKMGFELLKYPCDKIAEPSPDFNPLRPYPGSPCDPLIPKSWPEKEVMSFACGKSVNAGSHRL